MATEPDNEEPKVENEEQGGTDEPRGAGLVRTAWRAGVGAAVLTAERGGEIWRTCVERGADVEQGGGSYERAVDQVERCWATVREDAADLGARVRSSVKARKSDLEDRIGKPLREEVAALARRVEELARRVEGRVEPASPAD